MMLKEELWREIDSLPETQLKTLWDFVQFLQYITRQTPPPAKTRRVPGLDTGATWVSDDFDDHLPDSFWLGDTINDETIA
ncbi:MAG: DUF2281 domain-containing protein [Anaerolinea sp.]|nr:DUF2281 domain-containing protein [Anaerolinea sp.]